jgi:hypothetical protein
MTRENITSATITKVVVVAAADARAIMYTEVADEDAEAEAGETIKAMNI